MARLPITPGAQLHPPRGACGPLRLLRLVHLLLQTSTSMDLTQFHFCIHSLPQSKATVKSTMHAFFPFCIFAQEAPGIFQITTLSMTESLRQDFPTKVPLLCTEGLVRGADEAWATLVFLARRPLSVVCGIERENTRISREPLCNFTELGHRAMECFLFCPPHPPRDRVSLCSPGSPPTSQPPTQRCTCPCLPSAGIKGVHDHCLGSGKCFSVCFK